MPDTLPLLILPHRRAPGTVQMALDASLLHWASVGPDRVVFRTYAWSRPTLSLGRAEPFPEGWDVDAIREDGVDVARRPTGGDAVLHATELTFAVAASLPGPWNVRPRGFADLVAEALARAFQEAGLAAERSVPAPRDANAGRARPGLHACFSRLAPGEVRVGAYKVAGVASRFTRGAALTHASVPLSGEFRDVARFRRHDRVSEHDALDAGARSAAELLSERIHGERIAGALVGGLARAFGATCLEIAFRNLGLDDPADAPAASAGRMASIPLQVQAARP